MDSATIYNTIKETVQSCLPGSRVLLFGSRVRGEQDIHSDYDLLIVTPETFTPQEKVEWSTRIDRAIVKAIRAPVDLLLNSEEEILQKLQLPGHIIRSVMKEGMTL
jgi:predicted nucleotidyltransferase